MAGSHHPEATILRAPASGDGEVTTLRDSSLAFDHPKLIAVRDVWRARADGRGMIARAELTARDLAPCLRNLAILDVMPPSDRPRYRYRYVGTSLVEIYGEATGHYVDELIPAEYLPRWNAGYDAVIAARHPLRVLTRHNLPEVSHLQSESFATPLSDDGHTVNMLLIVSY
ncbi:MAG TPA: hypothetical protein VGM36_09250, partial [Rhizomicrobium sp.]